MNNSWARVGVKCVCVRQHAWSFPTVGGDPEYGCVYTISETDTHTTGAVGVSLLELAHAEFYNVKFFRPLAYPSQSLEHDVALFRNAPAHASDLESERA